MPRWWRTLRYRPALGLATGALSCRYLTSLNPAEEEEPSILYRYKDDRRPVARGWGIGTARPVCGLSGLTEFIHPFEGEPEATPRVLEFFLAHFGRRAADRDGCLFPRRLALTAAPDLLERLRPMLARAARAAGFRRWTIVPEIECLARSLPIRDLAPVVVADIGHTSTRFYGFTGPGDPGVAHGERGPGGREMAQAVLDAFRERQRLVIGPRTARDVLEETARQPADPLEWRGRSCETHLPGQVRLDGSDIHSYIDPVCRRIVEACAPVVERMSRAGRPRLHLTGGGAPAVGLSEMLADRLAIPVSVSPAPALDVARGLGIHLAFLDRQAKK